MNTIREPFFSHHPSIDTTTTEADAAQWALHLCGDPDYGRAPGSGHQALFDAYLRMDDYNRGLFRRTWPTIFDAVEQARTAAGKQQLRDFLDRGI